jgi:hypothetical protein
MADELNITLNRLGEKSRFLVERYRVVTQQRNNALSTIDELQKSLLERDKELQQLKLQVEYLTLSSSLTPDREALDKTAAIITGLVRDIDRCIADLKE